MKALLAVFAFLLLTVESAAAVGSPGGPQPAVWASHEIIVDLHNLPRRYSCDDLWYKFRAVLFAIGARPTQVLPYRCQGSAREAGYSPQVQLTFYTPEIARGALARTPDLQAQAQSVRLAPGAQPHLDAGDCELLRQLKDTLFRYLGNRISEFSLACAAASGNTPAFSLTVDALLPVQDSNTQVTQAAQPSSAKVAAASAAAQPHVSRSSSTARGT